VVVRVASGGTLTVTDAVALCPAEFKQVFTNVVSAVRLPEVTPALLSPVCHAAPALVTEQLAAFVEPHEIVDAVLYVASGSGDAAIVGTAGPTIVIVFCVHAEVRPSEATVRAWKVFEPAPAQLFTAG
jgi:hypothetical protein